MPKVYIPPPIVGGVNEHAIPSEVKVTDHGQSASSVVIDIECAWAVEAHVAVSMIQVHLIIFILASDDTTFRATQQWHLFTVHSDVVHFAARVLADHCLVLQQCSCHDAFSVAILSPLQAIRYKLTIIITIIIIIITIAIAIAIVTPKCYLRNG
jgi:hypothetical protein